MRLKTYVIKVTGGNELNVRDKLSKLQQMYAAVPTYLMEIRKGGVWRICEKVLIPGYVFIKCELTPDIYYKVKNTTFVTGWLGKGEPTSLTESDEEFVKLICNNGEPIPIQNKASEILCKTTMKIVNKRQRRVKVLVEVFGKTHTLTLGYQ